MRRREATVDRDRRHCIIHEVGARRVVRHDRRARPSAVVEWQAGGALAAASVRIPDGSWVSIEPRAGVQAPWGAIDRLWHGTEIGRRTTPLTVFGAVDWARVTAIPPLAEPARLPSGAGTAVLNLLAGLAEEQRVAHLAYVGPYPTEALFLALLECFSPAMPGDDPLAQFTAGGFAWTPAPFTPSFEDEAYVQWRDRIEKVVWRGRTYYREDWGVIRRRAPLRVHDGADGVRCALWALGAPLEDHLLLATDGTPHAVVATSATQAPPQRMVRAVRDGLVEIVVASSAAPLAAGLREITAGVTFTWGPVPLALAQVRAGEVRVSSRLATVFARRLATTATPERRARLGLAMLAEMASAVGDALRARAQARLAAASPDAQTAAFAKPDENPETARAITAAVAALTSEPVSESRDRGAPRLRRGAPSAGGPGGLGGARSPPCSQSP